MSFLEQLLSENIFGFSLIFVRVATIIMLLPGIAETFIPARIRLFLSAFITLLLLPMLQETLPSLPDNLLKTVEYIFHEFMIGAFWGVAVKIIFSCMHVAGNLISFQTGFANAIVFDPGSESRGAVVSSILSSLGILIIFVTNLHHIMIKAIFETYFLTPIRFDLPLRDFAEQTLDLAAQSFAIGTKMAFPFIMVNIIYQTCLGLIARLIPQLQVYFVALPVQILKSMLLIAISIPLLVLIYHDYFISALNQILSGG